MITLWGKAWAGKWTVWRLLEDALWYTIVDIGSLKRKLAEEMWLSIAAFDALGDIPWNEEEFDLKYEVYQQQMDPYGPTILDSRLWFYNQPKAYKVFLDVDRKESAKRIFAAKRSTEAYACESDVYDANTKRETKNQKRYMKLYGIDLYDFSQYDMYIDSTDKDPEQIASMILEWYEIWKKLSTTEMK